MVLLHIFGIQGLSQITTKQGGRMQGLGVDFIKQQA
jgi:hypothetical protein